MKNTLKLLILFLIVNFANAQKITVNADKYTIKGVGSKQTKFYTNKAFFNTLIVGDTTSSQSDPFRITTNARFDGRINIGGSYGTAGTYLRSSGNSLNPTWGAIDWSEIVNKPVFGNYLPLSGGIMTGYLTLSNSIRLGGVFENTWFGKNALISNTSGSSNVAIGNETLTLLSSHNYNVAVGATALKKVTASANTAIGGASMNSTTTGGYNVAVGISSLANNLTGSYNVAVGPYAGQYLLGTGNAIFGGYSATSERTRQNSMFLGNGSGGLYIFGDSLANIGLGTTRPKTKLQLHYANAIDYSTNYPEGYGSIHLVPLGNGSPVGTASTGISFGAYQTSGAITTKVNAGIHVASNSSYGTRMRFSTSNNLTNGALSRMIIDENGKVGIGNDTPAEMLDVTGNLKVSAEIRNTSLGVGIVHSSSIGTFSSSLLVNQDVSTSANIDVSKLGTGIISNLEFNNLDGLSSNVQFQLNAKLNVSTASTTYATKSELSEKSKVLVTNIEITDFTPSLYEDYDYVFETYSGKIYKYEYRSPPELPYFGEIGTFATKDEVEEKLSSTIASNTYATKSELNEKSKIFVSNVEITDFTPSLYEEYDYVFDTYAGKIYKYEYRSPPEFPYFGEIGTFATKDEIDTKQNELFGNGFVKAVGNTISYDNSTYLTTSSASANYMPFSGGTFAGKTNNILTENTAYSASTAFQNGNSVGVVNQIYNNSNSTLSYAGLKLTTRSSLPTSWSILNVNAGLGLGDLVFGYGGSTASSERMRLNNSGHLGIGKTPQRMLDVGGDISNDGNAYFATSNGNVAIGSFSATEKLQVAGGIRLGVSGTGYLSSAFTAASNWKHLLFGTSTFDGTNYITNSVGSNSIAVVTTDLDGIGYYTNPSSGSTTLTTSPVNFESYLRMRIKSNGNVGIGTNDPGQKLDVIGIAQANQFKISSLNTAPASATATGVLGEIRVTATHIYVCTATNTWVRASLATW